jgi:hypothetical protein
MGVSGRQAQLARGQLLHDFFGAAADHHHLDLAVDALAAVPRMKPMPPRICTPASAQNCMVCVAWFFSMQTCATQSAPLPDASPLSARAATASSQAAGGRDAHLHVHQLVADHLVLHQRRAEGLALARPGQRLVVAGLGEAQRHGRHAQPLAVEVGHDDLEALALLAHQVARRHAHVVKAQVRGVGAPPAHLVQLGAVTGPARRRAPRASRCRPRPWLRSVRTATVIQSARMPEVMKTFSPLTTHSSPSRRAVVRRRPRRSRRRAR